MFDQLYTILCPIILKNDLHNNVARCIKESFLQHRAQPADARTVSKIYSKYLNVDRTIQLERGGLIKQRHANVAVFGGLWPDEGETCVGGEYVGGFKVRNECQSRKSLKVCNFSFS